MKDDDSDEDIFLDDSFFVNRDYELTTFNFGNSALQLFCLRSSSRQLVWPGAVLLNNYLSGNPKMLEGLSIIELGSGVGITGILCSRFCSEVVLTDHNEEVLEILRKNIALESSFGNLISSGLNAEKLEWGNRDQLGQILQKYRGGFDLILGADICFQQSSVPVLFRTVEILLRSQAGKCRFILAYVSRTKNMDEMVINEAVKLGMEVNEVAGTRSIISNLEGVIYEIILPKQH
ncbi:protein N-lysine methyltransferase METTL21A isoform X2 [Dendrobium catenatum]|uniref:protein N-lysine methyltransferase METTL21A isoform X2 n=1 Tax=Dendrobium catenatum TaxID=906689 RepID=UPI0009F5B151|nr:protein N-lysine methyltransferase METTL21A isoform X2 [Dendrobium catenatum]